MVTPLARLVGVQVMRCGQQITAGPRLRQRGAQGRYHIVCFLLDGFRMLQALHKQLIEHRLHFCRVHHIRSLVHAELLGDEGEFFFQNLPHTVLHRVFQHKIQRTHHVLLPDAIHPPNALLDAHRVPRHVEIDDDVAELQVQTFATRVGGNQHARILRELLQAARARFHVHAAVERGDSKTPASQIVHQHGLRGNELRENQHL